jgi:hypothetical protein
MEKGTIISGAGHVALILWVILGDWLFSPSDAPPVQVAEVSLMTSAEFDAMAAAVPSTPEPKPQAPEAAPEVTPPEPVQPDVAEPAPEPPPVAEPDPLPQEPSPLPLPENNGVADAEPLPVVPDAPPPVDLAPKASPRPKPAPRVAPVPVDAPDPAADVAEVPVEAVTPEPTPEPPKPVPEEPAAAQEEAGTVLETEANKDQVVEASGAPKTSPRPKGKPVRSTQKPVETAAASSDNVTEKPVEKPPADDAVADAIAGALAEAVDAPAEDSGATNAPQGPPVTSGEKDALRVAVQQCWNVGSLSSDALRVTVTVAVNVAQNGVPDAASIRMAEFKGGSDAAARQAFEAARRAIIRCGAKGFPLPPEKYDQWRELELVFNPDGMRMR